MRMLGAAALAGWMHDPDPRGQDGQLGTWAQLAATGFLPEYFFSCDLGKLCVEKVTVLKVNIVSG